MRTAAIAFSCLYIFRQENGWPGSIFLCFVTIQPSAYAVPFPSPVTPGSPGTDIRFLQRRVRLHSFSANHFKNWLFLSLACGKSTRMTAKLRPLWGVKQRRQSVRVNFPRARPRNSTIFSQVCGKRMQPNPAPQKPDVRVWGTRCHRRGRRNGICGGLSSNVDSPFFIVFI